MKTVKMKLLESQFHIGHCQLTYATWNDDGERLVYCLQNNYGDKVKLLRCTQDGEPSHDVSFTKVKAVFERPKISEHDSEYAAHLKRICNRWIDDHEVVE